MKIETNTLPKGYDYKLCEEPLYIERSDIHGMGIFTDACIRENTVICQTHQMVNGRCLRVDIGGLINHSITPNCKLLEVEEGYFYIQAIRDIYPLEELTLDYAKSICSAYKK